MKGQSTKLRALQIGAIGLMCLSCDQTPKTNPQVEVQLNPLDSIAVGMTYDEVEKWLGKPQEIQRGVSQLKSDDELTSDRSLPSEARLQELDLRISVLKSGEETYAKRIESVGALLYVSWWYPQSRIDTIRYIIPSWRTGNVSIPHTEFFINGKSVSKDDYDIVGDTVYWGPAKVFIYPKDEWQQQKDIGLSVEPPQPAVKEIRKTFTKEKRQFIAPDTNYQAVFFRYCLTFDAASGRVVNKGYFPYQVTKLR